MANTQRTKNPDQAKKAIKEKIAAQEKAIKSSNDATKGNLLTLSIATAVLLLVIYKFSSFVLSHVESTGNSGLTWLAIAPVCLMVLLVPSALRARTNLRNLSEEKTKLSDLLDELSKI